MEEIEGNENQNSQENFEFLRYLQEVQKFPLEMEALQTSIESNRSTVRLADESITNFKETRTYTKTALWATLGVSVLTLIILIVQTFSDSKTEIKHPIKLNQKQVDQILRSQEKNSVILSSQIDSLKSELNKLNKTLKEKSR